MSTDRMTILQVLPALESGGVERGVLEVASAIVQAGHRSLVVSAPGRMVAELVQQGSEHFACPIGIKSPWTLRWVPWLRRLLGREKVDVIDIHSRLPGWIAWMAWKSLPDSRRPRFLSSVHGLHSVSRYSEIMCSGELVIVVSKMVQDYVTSNYPRIPVERLRLIHRGIDSREYPRGFISSDQWKSDFFGQYPRLTNQPIITLAGRITRLKGHLDLLQLIANLRDQSIEAHGLIVGEADPEKADYLNEIRRAVTSLGLDDRITFTGHRRDLKEIYSISRAVVSLSSTPESFGRTVAEALSIGTPVVGYDHGGVSEILAAQFAQGAVPLGNIDELMRRVREILQSDSPPAIGPNPFDKERMLRQTLDVYTELVSHRIRAVA